MDIAIQKVEEKMVYVTSDKEALRAYQMREMALSDWTSGINHARAEGIQEGKQEGIEEERIRIAKTLKAMGEPYKKIAGATGLSVEEIERI
ncbi:MAG: Rpn family recombination-promoting nuclease/putative transposase [Treponema sp.]|jgi:predicted transposase/invertase (TIGR01784 family)|nr:Rpn family recombination-promoting nuclease/putative transposase [Treponema sp.]